MTRHDDGLLGTPQPPPAGGALLRIKVDNDGLFFGFSRRDRQIDGERCLARSTLLRHHCESLHAHMVSCAAARGNVCAHTSGAEVGKRLQWDA